MLQPVRLILKLLSFIGRIQLRGLGIRLAIILSLGQVKSSLVVLYLSRSSSLVYSVWSSLYIVLYRDCITVTCLFLLTYTPQLHRRVHRLRIVVGLYTLKIASIKSAKSSQYYSYRLIFINLKYPYLRVLNLIQLLISGIDVRSTPYLYFSQPLSTYLLISAILYSVVRSGGKRSYRVRKTSQRVRNDSQKGKDVRTGS